jgi:polysaccharide biosynthesis protein VpsM
MRLLALSILSVLTVQAFAADGTGVQMGAFKFRPTIGLTFGTDSNVSRVQNNEVDSPVTIFSPAFRFDSGSEVRSLSLAYEADIGRYSDSKIDDYDDHLLSLSGRYAPTARWNFDGEGHYNRGHDPRGVNSRQGRLASLAIAPDEWTRRGVSGGVDFGAPGARGGVRLGLGTDDIAYRNNQSFARDADRSEDYIRGEFLYRLGAKTRAFLQARNNNIDYDRTRTRLNRVLDLDSSERLYSLGLEFDATAKITGRAAVQRINKDFDDRSIKDFSGTGYEIGLQFRPRSYSVFDLSASRRTDEAVNFIPQSSFTAADTNFLLVNDLTLGWTHNWTERFQTGVDIGTQRDKFRVQNADVRSDRAQFFGVNVDYRLQPWLGIGAGYRSYDRDSKSNEFDFDRDEFLLSLEASL